MKMLTFLLFLLLASSVFAQELIPGLEQESAEYQQYQACVTDCGRCESRCKDATLEEAARNNLDESFCNQLQDQGLEVVCLDNVYNLLAITNKDASFCDKLSDGKEGCRQSIVNAQALEAREVSLCDTEGCRANVFTVLASERNDASYCEQITDELAQANCKVNMGGVVPEVIKEPTPLNKRLIFSVLGGVAGVIIVLILTVVLLRRRGKKEALPEEDALKQRFAQLHQVQETKK